MNRDVSFYFSVFPALSVGVIVNNTVLMEQGRIRRVMESEVSGIVSV